MEGAAGRSEAFPPSSLHAHVHGGHPAPETPTDEPLRLALSRPPLERAGLTASCSSAELWLRPGTRRCRQSRAPREQTTPRRKPQRRSFQRLLRHMAAAQRSPPRTGLHLFRPELSLPGRRAGIRLHSARLGRHHFRLSPRFGRLRPCLGRSALEPGRLLRPRGLHSLPGRGLLSPSVFLRPDRSGHLQHSMAANVLRGRWL